MGSLCLAKHNADKHMRAVCVASTAEPPQACSRNQACHMHSRLDLLLWVHSPPCNEDNLFLQVQCVADAPVHTWNSRKFVTRECSTMACHLLCGRSIWCSLVAWAEPPLPGAGRMTLHCTREVQP